MNVLITGASGLLGKNIISILSKEVDYNLFFIHRNSKKPDHLTTGKATQADLSNINEIRLAFNKFPLIDIVLHLAAITHTNNKKKYYQINTEGTANLVKASEEQGVKKFIFLSSRVACQGGGDYAESKLQAEEIIKNSKLDWLILAPGEIYSLGGSDEINRLIKLIKSSPLVPQIGSGSYLLAPAYLDDIIEATIKAIKLKTVSRKRYILCGPEEISYNQLIKIITDYYGLKRLIIPIPLPLLKIVFAIVRYLNFNLVSYDQLQRLITKKPADISSAKIDLDFKPLPIIEGLTKLCSKGTN